MAEREKEQQPPAAPKDATLEGAQRTSRAMAENEREAERKQLDEVEPGRSAVYIVGGREVGPNGQPIGEDGKEGPLPPGWAT